MQSYSRKADDVEKPINVTFPTGTNLTGSTVRLQVVGQDGVDILDELMTITGAENPASATYAPAADELDVPGIYRMLIEVNYSDGSVESYPSPGYARVLVEGGIV